MDMFIRALRRTRNVAAAARAAGMSRQAAYRLRARRRAGSLSGWCRVTPDYTGGQAVTPGDTFALDCVNRVNPA